MDIMKAFLKYGPVAGVIATGVAATATGVAIVARDEHDRKAYEAIKKHESANSTNNEEV